MAELRNLRRHTVSKVGARHIARGTAPGVLLVAVAAAAFAASGGPLIPDSLLRTILGELSVDTALQETAAIASRARYPNSQEFFDSAEYVAVRAREYGLQNVNIERFPQSGPMWDPAEAEVSVVAPTQKQIRAVLAQYSADADITAELVDGFHGEIRGKIVLSDEEPEAAMRAGGSHGVAAVISAASGEFFGRRTPPDAILWSMVSRNQVALMISPRSGEELRALLKREPVTVHLRAKAQRTAPGAIGMVIGEIPGSQPGQDIVVAAHLDHQKPGANDNASGSGTLLELVRTTNRLIAAGKIPKPRRTIRFWWTTEVVAEQAYFRLHPDEAQKILLAIVLDQAGGELNHENNLIVINNPGWLPSYTDDLIENLVEYAKDRYAPAEHEPDPLLVAARGSRQSLRPVYWDYQEITDEVAFESRARRIPGIALAVPSLDLIHTDLDTVDRLDPTWMKRTALFTLAPALYLANAGHTEADAIAEYVFRRSVARLSQSGNPASDLEHERRRIDSVKALDPRLDTLRLQTALAAIGKALQLNPEH